MRRLTNLLNGLPEQARLCREDPTEPRWGFVEELLAQLIEEVSVLAAEHRRKEPRTVSRPHENKPENKPLHGGLLEHAMAKGMVRHD